MMDAKNRFVQLLEKESFNKDELIELITCHGEEKKKLFEKAAEIKRKFVGNKVYFRGLIEFSNICAKNCYYCGIRSGNKKLKRYYVTEEEVLEAVKFAYENKYASLVIQSGERSNKMFVNQITKLLIKINKLTNYEMGITLSLGEQTEDTFRIWKEEAGVRRYLLRIETSNPELYKKIHPDNSLHSYHARLKSLETLKKLNYQVGTGVMIGLPFQTIDDLADDLIFFKEFDIDMAGMGPYIEHEDTPLYKYKKSLLPKKERFDLSLKMVALLRIIMKDINIAATTAMQTLDKMGREKALKVGSNIIMPNLTPVRYRESYLLYEDKPCIDEEASECKNCLEARIHIAGDEIGYGEWGDSLHFDKRKGNKN